MVSVNGITFPQVDISDFKGQKDKISSELGHAAREIGFFYVTGSFWRPLEPFTLLCGLWPP